MTRMAIRGRIAGDTLGQGGRLAMAYQPLNEQTVLDYIRSRPAMGRVFDKGAPLKAVEVGDGNLNQIFIITSQGGSGGSAVLKQALPYLRVAGESWPLNIERMRFETQALLLHNELAPGRAPEIYDHDAEMYLVIMEYLCRHEIMRKSLVARKRFPLFVDHITTFMARTLFFTSDLYLTGMAKREVQNTYRNSDLRKLQEDFIYTNPLMDSPDNKWNPFVDKEVQEVRRNGRLKALAAEMKEGYMTHSQALIHADLHTGSIMLNEEDTKVIDPEFAFFGPIGYDVGAVMQNLVLNYLAHYVHTPDPDERAGYQSYLLDMMCAVWREFARKFDDLWVQNNTGDLTPSRYWDFPGGEEAFADFRRRYIHNIFRDVVGHGGCKMLRRMMGIVNVWDITVIKDLEKRAIAERIAIRIGMRWLLERDSINSEEDMAGIVLEETAGVVV
jgi:5-methylthioribose kinase